MPDSPLERLLKTSLKRAEALYRRAIAAILPAEKLQDSSFEEINQYLVRLQPFLEQIQVLESELAPLRLKWTQLNQRPGAELRQALADQEGVLKTLIQKIQSMESILQRQRQEAVPAVDSFVVHQQMQRAYQQISR